MIFQLLSIGTMISFIKFIKMIISKPEKQSKKIVTYNEKIIIGLMALFCLMLGIFGDYYTKIILNYNGYFPIAKQIAKISIYFIYYFIGYGLYKVLIEKRKWIKYLSGIELGFNSIGLSIATFFTVTTLYMHWVYL